MKKGKKLGKGKLALIISGGVVLALGFGVLGFMVGQNVFEQKVSYNSFDIDDLEDDNAALFNKYSKSNISTTSKICKPYEIAELALHRVSFHDYVKVDTAGSVKASIVEQAIKSVTMRTGNDYFFESLSYSSMVKTAWRFYQDNETVETYEGSLKSFSDYSYNGMTKKSTYSEYVDEWGMTYDRPSIYIVSSKTILDEGTITTLDNGNYQVVLNLNSTYSVVRYVRQMVSTSKLSKEPIFSSVQLTYEIGQDFNLVSISTFEKYKVYKGFWVDSVGSLINEFSYDDTSLKIPSLEEMYDYQ